MSIHSAVEWLGQQNWSNGNVAIYGKSYEGATAWEAAAQGSEHLKTIVPVSGTTALGLYYTKMEAEARSQIMHSNYGVVFSIIILKMRTIFVEMCLKD